jgi:hypothetical protein
METAWLNPLLAWNWNRLFAPVERAMGNEQAMIRFGMIAMCLAIWIICWRK